MTPAEDPQPKTIDPAREDDALDDTPDDADETPVIDERTLARLARIRAVLEDLKAEEIVQIDLVGRSIVADGLLIATATSAPHAKAIVDQLQVRLKGEGIRPDHVETDEGRSWIVVDYGDVVVHVFQQDQRRYYDLESLWDVKGYPGRDHNRFETPGEERRGVRSSSKTGARRRGPLISRGFRPKPPKIFK